jgi:hypothetical protein
MDLENTLFGGTAISKYLKVEKWFAYEMIKNGVLPASKMQNTLVTTKDALDAALQVPLGVLIERAKGRRG